MSQCPRCRQELAEAQVDEVAVRLCRDCQGIFLRHRDLTQLLEASWRLVPRATAEATAFHTPAGGARDHTLRCPACRQPMEQYGYMGIAAIQIDRCDPCASLWLDADELQNMLLALAKTNYRAEQSRAGARESLDLGAAVLQASAASQAAAAQLTRSWLFRRPPAGEVLTAVPALLRLLLR